MYVQTIKEGEKSMLNFKELRLSGNKITYQGVVVATINDLDMSQQRFKFENFIKDIEKGKFNESK